MRESRTEKVRDEEKRFLAQAIRDPERFRERLVLAIALSPPKSKKTRPRSRASR